MKELLHYIHLLIIWVLNEMNIPTSPTPSPLLCQSRVYRGLSFSSNLVKNRESQLERYISTPPIFSKFHSILHPCLKLSISAKSLPTHLDTSPQTTHMYTPTQLGGPSLHSSPNFKATTLLKAVSPQPQNAIAISLVRLYLN